MLLKEKVNFIRILVLVVFALVFLVFRIPLLDYDAINPDGVNWHYRSEQFIVGLKTDQLEKTYQHYHPGVTLMWLTGPAVELVKQFFPDNKVYNHMNFLTFHFVSKATLVFSHLILSMLSIYLLTRIFELKNFYKPFLLSVCTVFLFSLEPFFLGNSRLLHLDILLSLFLFNGLLLVYIASRNGKILNYILAGTFLAFAFLTKSVGIGGILFAIAFIKYKGFLSKNYKSATFNIGVLLLTFVALTFLFFPALWQDPFNVLIDIFSEGERVGVRGGHGQIVLGDYTRDPGIPFYFLVFLMKLSPFTILGVFAALFFAKKNLIKQALKDPSFDFFILLFYIGYIFVMIYPSKKLDRYMLPVFPMLVFFAVEGYYFIYQRLKDKIKVYIYGISLLLLFLVFIMYPLLNLFPYYFTYTSPLFKDAQTANKIVAQKPFGIGMPMLKEHILQNYGYYPRLGFIDTKPMRAIYMSSRIFDIRESGTSNYDLLVLAVNEEIPKDVLDSGTEFKLDSSVYINGLEYWRIYVKEN